MLLIEKSKNRILCYATQIKVSFYYRIVKLKNFSIVHLLLWRKYGVFQIFISTNR